MWKQIDGFQNYEINDKGEVRNIQSGKILKPWIGVGGYVYINPTNGHGKPMPKRLHRLVAKAFVPNPYNKPQVNHKDGDKTNNCADNLEWVTNQENRNHAVKLGLQIHGERCPWSKLTQSDVDYIRKHPEEKSSALAKKYKLSLNYINAIKRYKTWK